MNVKLSNQQVRFRILKAELPRLLAGESLETKTIFLDETFLCFRLGVSQQKNRSWIERDKDTILLHLSESLVSELAKKTPAKEGVSLLLGEGSPNPLKVIIEVDVFNK